MNFLETPRGTDKKKQLKKSPKKLLKIFSEKTTRIISGYTVGEISAEILEQTTGIIPEQHLPKHLEKLL